MRIAEHARSDEVCMVPFASVVGCVLIIVGLWGSVLTLHRGDRPRF